MSIGKWRQNAAFVASLAQRRLKAADRTDYRTDRQTIATKADPDERHEPPSARKGPGRLALCAHILRRSIPR
jgi:hypothetical protein